MAIIKPEPTTKTFTIVYHKISSSSISDLTGTTWEFIEYPEMNYGDIEYNINFISNTNSYYSIKTSSDGVGHYVDYGYLYYKNSSNSYINVYDYLFREWTNQAYKTIQITGGTDTTNSDLIAWLQANATQVIEPTGHTLTYSGDLSSYLDVKVNNVSVSSGTTISNGDKVEVYLDNSYPNYELLVNGEEITKSNIAILKKDISIEVNEVIANYLTFSSPNTFTLEVVDHFKYFDGTLEYSTDAKNWSTWNGTTVLSSSQSGTTKYLYMRGSNNTYITGSSASNTKAKWVLTGSNISCDGNIENLLDYQTVTNGNHSAMATYCYYYMFNGCTNLTTAPSLPATTLANYCYSNMFAGCKSLTTAPELPATTLATYCYYYMFNGCTNLTTPAIMAGGTTQATSAKKCCNQMYYNCTSLNIYTSSSGHTPCYKAITYSTSSSSTNYRSSFNMFYNCYIDGVQSTTTYLDAGTQYYY